MTTRLCSDWGGVKDLLDGLAATISDGSLKHVPITPDDLGIPGYEGHAWGTLVRPEDVVERAPGADGQLEVSRYVAPGMLDVNPEDPREGHELALRFRLLVLRQIDSPVFAGRVFDATGSASSFLGGALTNARAASSAYRTLKVLQHAQLFPSGRPPRWASDGAVRAELAPIIRDLRRHNKPISEEAVSDYLRERNAKEPKTYRLASVATLRKHVEAFGGWPEFVASVLG